MLSDETASLSEVAAAIGREPEWLRRNWRRLAQTQGFPRRLATGWVWPRAAVKLWLRSGGFVPAMPQPANSNAFGVDPQAAYRAALDARYGGANQ